MIQPPVGYEHVFTMRQNLLMFGVSLNCMAASLMAAAYAALKSRSIIHWAAQGASGREHQHGFPTACGTNSYRVRVGSEEVTCRDCRAVMTVMELPPAARGWGQS